MGNRALSFCIILYIVIFYRIVLESLGIFVSNGLFLAFYIFVYLSGLASLFHWRSPPISTNFFRDSCWLEVFYMVDKTLARFIKYMEVALVHRRIDYIKEISKIQEYEEELTDYKVSENSIDERNFIDLDILNEKEKELFNMLYVKGFSYKEISKKTNTSVKTLELRRYRAIQKIKKKMGEM